TADKLLEEMRETTSALVREAKLKQFDEEIKKDLPTIFTYAPKFIYVISPEIKNVTIPSLANQSDRFLEIEKWYMETDNVWSIFAHN
ncbi:MAG: hypothetical protein AAB861_03745, partial [Patescibacteria group bacterium]